MANECEAENYVAEVWRKPVSRAAMTTLRDIIMTATYLQLCSVTHNWAHQRRDFIQCAAGQTNPRFLILPWIRIPNLGSHILSLVRRHLPIDWAERYNITPVLIETFVETPRYTGAVYRASGWTHVGTTQGRGRYDRHTKRAQPKKDIWLRPLRKDWRRTLNR